MAANVYDLAIIGGGINGAGLARDAAGRGLKVLLIEQGDLAGGTSSASTKLIHGGLRYLEQGDFRLVREALTERETLLRIAPHLVRPLRFVLPLGPASRPAWMLRAGLAIYDWLAPRRILPRSRRLALTRDEAGAALKPLFTRAFEYSDCQVDDARLVVLNAVDAAERGATVLTRCRCVSARRGEDWTLTLDDRGQSVTATARALVNAGGAWAGDVAAHVLGQPLAAPVRLVKGSHIVLPRLFAHGRGYIFQNRDGRVAFALPWHDLTLIGTTDVEFAGDPATAAPTPDEIAYLCEAASAWLRQPISPADVIHAFAGVRALAATTDSRPQDASRDYALDLDAAAGAAPLLTIVGCKLRRFRRLAEAALARLAPHLPAGAAWTARAPLPGGEFPFDMLGEVMAQARRTWPFAGERMIARLVAAYGERIGRILGDATAMPDLGECVFGDFTAAELRYLMQHEFARTPEDVLWRRTKLGLRLDEAGRAALTRLMATEQTRV